MAKSSKKLRNEQKQEENEQIQYQQQHYNRLKKRKESNVVLHVGAFLVFLTMVGAQLLLNMHHIRMTIEDISYSIRSKIGATTLISGASNADVDEDYLNFMNNVSISSNSIISDNDGASSSNKKNNKKKNRKLKVQYTCPEEVKTAENDKKKSFDWYEVDTSKHRENRFDYLHFKDQTYAGWGLTPNQRKELTNDGWIHWYGEHLKSGDAVYESAMGAGLTMYVILESLRDKYGITNLEIHGNDYLPDLLKTANQLYNYEQDQLKRIAKGEFCFADSSNLQHIPTSSFDLAFTGYLNPIQDPLNMGQIMGAYYCYTGTRLDLIEREYQIQEDWIAQWVSELLRIVKPGGIVIIEAMGDVRCEDVFEWGGVNRSWWTNITTIQKYGWDVHINTDEQTTTTSQHSSIEIVEFNPSGKFSQWMQMDNHYNIKIQKYKGRAKRKSTKKK